jgi:hypothetical protein
MFIKYVKGDMFGPLLERIHRTIVLPHIVNSKGAWGKGFVVPLGRTFPLCKEKYLEWSKDSTFGLGKTQIVDVGQNIHVCNMVAQILGGPRPLFYNHLSRCLDDVAKFVLEQDNPEIVCPAFGSGLAGGNWKFIESLIEDCWLRNNIPVTVYYLPGTLDI